MSAIEAGRQLAAIFGVAGPELGAAQRAFFAEADPVGFILFQRNCQSPDQVRRLVDDLRDCVGRDDAPVLIDQEGGRVARLHPPHWRSAPPQAVFGRLWQRDRIDAVRAAGLNARLIGDELARLGITVDCLPALDLSRPETTAAIGDRALSDDPEAVAALGRAVAGGLAAAGVLPVIKHMPGHGRARVDSHHALPAVDAGLAELADSDFLPFARLAHLPIGMTGHILFEALDPDRPATLSPTVIADVIRGRIGFSGLLLTDDLSMKALEGTVAERAARALDAGCDLALHCNGELGEMKGIAAAIRPLDAAAAARVRAAEDYRLTRRSTEFDIAAVQTELAALLEGISWTAT
ncbi:beta-N-acetylhexosaminidase [Oceanibacterium hippocampi]|uniref:beta-N-acetylhexosaminidase n=1 Tax=Oceanibacterium hippocampi TaxID=745714 RepID=A0A1Y5U298_9PROT|nr:beta-N-acetylhexosaminidase [Oceanibacterium hippocampi]SLN77233.1 Beta-hexosaminidase [Oceanibacterium hippocampi]